MSSAHDPDRREHSAYTECIESGAIQIRFGDGNPKSAPLSRTSPDIVDPEQDRPARTRMGHDTHGIGDSGVACMESPPRECAVRPCLLELPIPAVGCLAPMNGELHASKYWTSRLHIHEQSSRTTGYVIGSTVKPRRVGQEKLYKP